jgi:N-acetylmuramoyl-L-alanine amidase
MTPMKKWIGPLLIMLACVFSAQGAKYHKVPALPGDGVFSLLRRYELDRFSCNHQEFYKINNLKENDGLHVGKYYFVPILIYVFNGKTIRSSIGIDNWDLAVKIQDYNQMMEKAGIREKGFKEDNVLWVPYHLLHCPEEDISLPALPEEALSVGSGEITLANASGGNRRFPIFGKKYEYVPLESKKLAGKVYYIVSGHGGPDPGAMGKRAQNTLCEDEYAYDVSLRLVRNLIAHGAIAYMIVRDPDDGIREGQQLDCDYDEVVWGNQTIFRQQKARLTQRAEIVNELYQKHKAQGVKEQNLIVIHVDSRNKRKQIDLFFYHHPNSKEGKVLAEQMQATMSAKYRKNRASGEYHGSVTARDLFMLRETKPRSVYIELGNIRHPFDQQRIIIENNRQALANWLFEGLIAK